jgi:plasmid stabilization system protein ParE
VLKVILSQQAIEDLAQICDYLQQRNPAAAKRLMKTFREKFNLLASFPYLGRERNDILLNLCCLIVRDYRIFISPAPPPLKFYSCVTPRKTNPQCSRTERIRHFDLRDFIH